MIFPLSIFLRRGFSDIATKEAIQNVRHRLCKTAEGPKAIEKSIRVSIIGKANVGKSTLINAIMRMHICAASKKPQTTMHFQRVFSVQGDTQIILLDTPGIVSAKQKKKCGIKDKADVFTIQQIRDVDLVGVIVDATDKYTKFILPSNVKELMKTFPSETEMVLILNKVDRVKVKINLLKYVDKLCNDLKSSPDVNLNTRQFTRIFMISALENDGVNDVVDYIRSVAIKKDKCRFPGRLSDHSDHQIVEDRVRAALLEKLKYNLPYDCCCKVEYMEENALGKVTTVVVVTCPNDFCRRIIVSPSFSRELSFICEEDLGKVFGKPVLLKIHAVTRDKNK